MPERRGHAETRTRVLISGTRRGLTPKLIADLRRQSAIEPEIGHMKTDGRLTRCTLKGSIGDALFAALCACGHNIRKILAHLRSWLVWIVAAILNAAFPRIASVSLSHQPERIVQGQRDKLRHTGNFAALTRKKRKAHQVAKRVRQGQHLRRQPAF